MLDNHLLDKPVSTWYPLQKRSMRSHVSGDAKLTLSLATDEGGPTGAVDTPKPVAAAVEAPAAAAAVADEQHVETEAEKAAKQALLAGQPSRLRSKTVEEKEEAAKPGQDDEPRDGPTLVVTIVEARDVLAKDDCGTSDPFCEVVVGGAMRKTHVCLRNLNPRWDRTFRFEWTLSPEDLQISMWDDDSNESDSMQVGDMNWDVDFLGKVDIKAKQLKEIQAEGARVNDNWYKLGKRSLRSHVSGELRIRLSWENIKK